MKLFDDCPNSCEVRREYEKSNAACCCAWYLDNVVMGDKELWECPDFDMNEHIKNKHGSTDEMIEDTISWLELVNCSNCFGKEDQSVCKSCSISDAIVTLALTKKNF